MCKQCQLNPVYEFTNQRKLCKMCFIKWFEKKFLYIVRKFNMFNMEDRVGYSGDGSFREVVLESLLKMFAERRSLKLIKLPSGKKTDRIALATTADLEAYKISEELIKGEVKNLKQISPVEKTGGKITIKPLYLFLDKEVLIYAKLKKLKFKEKKSEAGENKFSELIDNLEKKHPEIKHAIINYFLELRK